MIKINKSLLYTTALEIVFTIIVILLLVSIRQKAISYLYDVQSLSSEINTIQEQLGKQNLSTYDQNNIKTTLSTVDQTLNKGLILLKVVLPISLLLLSLIFYYFLWRIAVKTKLKKFLIAAIIPLIICGIILYLLLNYLSYYFGYLEEANVIYVIGAIILGIIVYYFSLFFLVNENNVRENKTLAIKSIKKMSLPVLITILTRGLYFILVFIIFFLSYVKAPIIFYAIGLSGIILLLNLERNWMIKKIRTE